MQVSAWRSRLRRAEKRIPKDDGRCRCERPFHAVVYINDSMNPNADQDPRCPRCGRPPTIKTVMEYVKRVPEWADADWEKENYGTPENDAEEEDPDEEEEDEEEEDAEEALHHDAPAVLPRPEPFSMSARTEEVIIFPEIECQYKYYG